MYVISTVVKTPKEMTDEELIACINRSPVVDGNGIASKLIPHDLYQEWADRQPIKL